MKTLPSGYKFATTSALTEEPVASAAARVHCRCSFGLSFISQSKQRPNILAATLGFRFVEHWGLGFALRIDLQHKGSSLTPSM
jgi:hypothetical protein